MANPIDPREEEALARLDAIPLERIVAALNSHGDPTMWAAGRRLQAALAELDQLRAATDAQGSDRQESLPEYLRRALASFPGAIVAQVPAGVAVSCGNWIKRDGDRCGAYVLAKGTGWVVQDDGLTLGGWAEGPDGRPVLPAYVADAGLVYDPEECCFNLPVSSRDAIAAAVLQLLAVLWRIDAEAVERVG